jgi:hypothetical protein
MKTLSLLAAALLLLSACDIVKSETKSENLTSQPTATPVATATPTPTTSPSPTPLPNTILGVVYENNKIHLWDGDHFLEWKTGAATFLGGRKIAIDDYVYQIPATGWPTSIKRLPITPDWATESGGVYYSVKFTNSNTSVWIDNTETVYSWAATDVIKMASGQVLLNRTSSGFWSPDGYANFLNPKNGKILVYDYDSSTRTAKILDESGVPKSVSWATNFFGSARDWLKSGSVWYANNGFTWNGTTLTKDGSAMKAWLSSSTYPAPANELSESATLAAVGTNWEAGESVLYWLECNSGYIFRYTPSLDKIESAGRLYIGTGTQSYGLNVQKNLNAYFLNEYVYFSLSGTVYRWYMWSGNVTTFYNNAKLWVLE